MPVRAPAPGDLITRAGRPHPMGRQQLRCLQLLVKHGKWNRCCSWKIDTPANTETVLEKLIERDMAYKAYSSEGPFMSAVPTYYPSEAAFAVAVHQAIDIAGQPDVTF